MWIEFRFRLQHLRLLWGLRAWSADVSFRFQRKEKVQINERDRRSCRCGWSSSPKWEFGEGARFSSNFRLPAQWNWETPRRRQWKRICNDRAAYRRAQTNHKLHSGSSVLQSSRAYQFLTCWKEKSPSGTEGKTFHRERLAIFIRRKPTGGGTTSFGFLHGKLQLWKTLRSCRSVAANALFTKNAIRNNDKSWVCRILLQKCDRRIAWS